MAIFRLQIDSLSRADGRRATSSAAYRAGERIRDERSGKVYDHTKRGDVLHKEIRLPAKFSAAESQWAQARSTLWNAAEQAERRENARVAREYQVALPAELSVEQNLALTRAFATLIAERYKVAIDMTIHAPREGGDPRGYHAHLLSTTREVTSSGLGAKADPEKSDALRRQLGLAGSSAEFKFLRERWAGLTNEALRAADVSARVDHRSLAARGIDREPAPRIPIGMIRRERMGLTDAALTLIREKHRERVAARLSAANPVQAERPNLEELQRRSAQAWLQYRAQAQLSSAATQASRGESSVIKGVENDLAL